MKVADRGWGGRKTRTSCRTIGSSSRFSSTPARMGQASTSLSWPSTYANSCLSKADGSLKPALPKSVPTTPRYKQIQASQLRTSKHCNDQLHGRRTLCDDSDGLGSSDGLEREESPETVVQRLGLREEGVLELGELLGGDLHRNGLD